LGFRRALVPVSADVPNADLDVVRVSTLYDAVVWAGLVEPDTGRVLGVPKLRALGDHGDSPSRQEVPSK
jgi:hypothetical protein